MRRGAMRWAAALILGAALAHPALASPGTTRNVQEPASLSRLWEAAATWFAGGWETVVAELTSDHGPATDPNGATTTSDSDRGPASDPNG